MRDLDVQGQRPESERAADPAKVPGKQTAVEASVHRQGAGVDEASVWLTDDIGVRLERLNVKRLTPAELHLQPTSSPLIGLER